METDRDKKTLEERLADWLSQEGYRLEYLAHKAFQDAGIRSTLGAHFKSAEGKLREIDVSAFEHILACNIERIVRVMCECKYSKDLPWVLLTSGLKSDLYLDWGALPMSGNIRTLTSNIHPFAAVLQRSWHFAPNQIYAHSIVQGLRRSNDDKAYDSLQKITNAVWDYVESADDQEENPFGLVAIPCLIVEAPLFYASFDYMSGRFILKPARYGRISWDGCRHGTLVDVVHADAMGEYARLMHTTFQCILEVINRMTDL